MFNNVFKILQINHKSNFAVSNFIKSFREGVNIGKSNMC